MAHYKRHRPRTAGTHHATSRGYWLAHYPRWWDVIFHTRPHRRHEREVLEQIRTGVIDADAAAWPRWHRPHNYYW